MEAKFTPGPWRSVGGSVFDADDGLVVSLTNGFSRSKVQKSRDVADPLLIAAAPDLYAAVEEMLSIWDMGSDPSYAAIDRWRSALDKARGE